MSLVAFGLILLAAVLHASWNVIAKRANAGVAFIWVTFAVTVVVEAPFAVWLATATHARFDAVQLLFIAGNGVLHVIYFVALQRGYRSGDLSVVYPLARGTGPVMTVALAGAIFHEHPTPIALAGAALVTGGIFLTASKHASRTSILYGVATGLSIAAYTLWDKESVAFLGIAPIIYDWGGNVARLLLLTPFIAHRRSEIVAAWRVHGRAALGIGILSPAAYLLVLWVLISTPVSYVAPAREISILIGTLAGTLVFREVHGRRRFIASAVILIGVIALALG